MGGTANESPASAELAGELAALAGLLAGAAAAEERALLQVQALQREVAEAEAEAEAVRAEHQDEVLNLGSAAISEADGVASEISDGAALIASARQEGAAVRQKLRASQKQGAARHGCLLVGDRLFAQADAAVNQAFASPVGIKSLITTPPGSPLRDYIEELETALSELSALRHERDDLEEALSDAERRARAADDAGLAVREAMAEGESAAATREEGALLDAAATMWKEAREAGDKARETEQAIRAALGEARGAIKAGEEREETLSANLQEALDLAAYQKAEMEHMTRTATEAAEGADAQHAALSAELVAALADHEEQVAGLDDCMRQ
ncbi:hypothetical protein T484DRAFT_1819183, partial [Baffinella frigidus]